jgi:class 3 adenylate cyclase/GAF domain-containing protein
MQFKQNVLKSVFIRLVLSVIGLAFIPILSCFQTKEKESIVVDGYLDLRNHDFSQSKPISLRGAWSFYPGEFIEPDSTKTTRQSMDTIKNWEFMGVPGTWTIPKEKYSKFPSNYKATYRLLIDFPEEEKLNSKIAIQMPTVLSAYRLYWNGKFLAEEGSVDEPGSPFVNAPVTRILELPIVQSKRNELLIHVSNELISNAGIRFPILMANKERIEQDGFLSYVLVTFLFGALTIIGLYHIGYYFARRSDLAPFYFGTFAISIGMWLAQATERLIPKLIPSLSWGVSTRLEYGSFYAGIFLFPLFISAVFPKKKFPLFRKVIVLPSIVLFGSVFFLPFPIFLDTLPYAQGFAGLSVIYCFMVIVQGFWKKELGGSSMFLSFLILAFTVIHDLFVSAFALDSSYVAPFGFLAFILAQSFILALFHSQTYNRLEELRDHLEKTVEERTAKLYEESIQSARLIQTIQKQKNDSETLAILARETNRGASIEELLEPVAFTLNARLGKINLALYTANDDASLLELKGGFNNGELDSLDNYSDFIQKISSDPLKGGIHAQIFQRGKTFHSPRVNQKALEYSEIDKKLYEIWKYDWFMIVPLMLKGRCTGLLSVSGNKTDSVPKNNMPFIEKCADLIAGAVQNLQLVEQVRLEQRQSEKERENSEILAKLSKEVVEGVGFNQILSTISTYLEDLIGKHNIGFYLCDEEAKNLVFTASTRNGRIVSFEEVPEIMRIVPIIKESGSMYRCHSKNRQVYFPKIPKELIETSTVDRVIQQYFNLDWVLVVPISKGNIVIGVIALSAFGDLNLSKSDRNRIQQIVGQIGGAIQSKMLLSAVEKERNSAKRLQEEAEAAQQETEILAELARQANETINLKNLCSTLFDHLERHYAIKKQALFIVDTNSYTLEPVDGRGTEDPEILQKWLNTFRINLEKDSGTLASTYKRQKSFYLKRIPKYLESKDLEIVNTLKPSSILQVPLVVQDQTVAIMIADPRVTLKTKDLTSIERLCNQIAGAVKVVSLLQSTQIAREEAVVAKEEAEVAREESDHLLENVLPKSIAKELKENGSVEPVLYESVSVLFTDFVGFTTAASTMSPTELIQELDGCFSQFDEVANRNSLEKLKTIGDAYMCAGGLPIPTEHHAIDTVLAALEFRAFMKQMAEVKEHLGFPFWQIRIGIHTGPVTAGVIGKNKFAYDIWGDTVNIASRMESSGKPGEVNISGSTYAIIKDLFDCEYRGKVKAKGKGELDMYFVQRIKEEFSADVDGLLPNAKFEMAR